MFFQVFFSFFFFFLQIQDFSLILLVSRFGGYTGLKIRRMVYYTLMIMKSTNKQSVELDLIDHSRETVYPGGGVCRSSGRDGLSGHGKHKIAGSR